MGFFCTIILDKGLKYSSVFTYLTCIKTALKDAYSKYKLTSKNFGETIKAKQPNNNETNTLTLEEIRKIATIKSQLKYEVQLAWLFSFYTGLRISDVQQLTWKQVEFYFIEENDKKQRCGRIKKRIQKTQRFEYLPLSEGAIDLLDSLTKQEKFVFYLPRDANSEDINNSKNIAGRKNMTTAIKKIALRAGIEKKVNWHITRHSFASQLINNNTPIYTVQKLLTHKSIKSTERCA